MEQTIIDPQDTKEDHRFQSAVDLFNSREWYLAHDLLEELWHESSEPERQVLQGILQIAVAQLHLERGNLNGATILYGEGLGRLRKIGLPDLGLDLEQLCNCVEKRLQLLQQNKDPDEWSVPFLYVKD